MNEELRDFGKLISVRRASAGLSRDKLAVLAKLSESTIKNVERGKTKLSRKIVLCLRSVVELGLLDADLPQQFQADLAALPNLSVKLGELLALNSSVTLKIGEIQEAIQALLNHQKDGR